MPQGKQDNSLYNQLYRRQFGEDPYTQPQQTTTPDPQKAEMQNASIFGDLLDSFEQGVYQSAQGITELVGADSATQYLQNLIDEQSQTMTTASQEALQKPFFTRDAEGNLTTGEGLTDLRTWVLQLANVAGQFAATAVPGGALGKVASVTGKLSGASRGLAYSTSMGLTGGSSAQGQAALQGKQVVEQTPLDQLMQSPTFLEELRAVNEENPNASIQDKTKAARQRVADRVAADIKTDPVLLATNFLTSAIADPVIGGVLGRTVGKGLAARIGKGFALEGSTESLQGGMEQSSINQAVQANANPNLDTNQGVAESALTEGLIGGVFGGGMTGIQPARPDVNKDVPENTDALNPSRPEPAPTGDPSVDQAAQNLSRTNAEKAREIDQAVQDTQQRNQQEQSALKNAQAFLDMPTVARQTGERIQQTLDQLQRGPQEPIPSNEPKRQAPSEPIMRSNGKPFSTEKSMQSSKPYKEAQKIIDDNNLDATLVTEKVDGGFAFRIVQNPAKEQAPNTEPQQPIDRSNLDEPTFSRRRNESVVSSQDTVDIAQLNQEFDQRQRTGDVEPAPETPRRQPVQGLLIDGRAPIEGQAQRVSPTLELPTTTAEQQTQSELVVKADGKPFASEQSMKRSKRYRETLANAESNGQNVTVEQIDGGFGFRVERPVQPQKTGVVQDGGQLRGTQARPEATQNPQATQDTTRAQGTDTQTQTPTDQPQVTDFGNLDEPAITRQRKRAQEEQQPEITVKANGQPFASEQSMKRSKTYRDAVASAEQNGQDSTVVTKRVDGGFGFRVEQKQSAQQQQTQAKQAPAVDESLAQPAEDMPSEIDFGNMVSKTTPINKPLYHETSPEQLGSLIRDVFANTSEQGVVKSIYTSDNPDLALGQGKNKGAFVELDGRYVSGKVDNSKPGAAIADGNEYVSDYINKNAVKSFILPKNTRLKGASRVFAQENFDTEVLPDGRTKYTRKSEKPLDQGVFESRSEPSPEQRNRPKNPVQKTAVTKLAKDFIDQYRGAAKVQVDVYNSPSDLKGKFGFVGNELTYAAYIPSENRVVMFTDNIPDMKTAKAALRHEILAHHGLRWVIGAPMHEEVIQRVLNTRKSDNAKMKRIWQEVEQDYPDVQDPYILAEEVFARVAESEQSGLGAAWERVVAALKQALRAVGLLDSGQISTAEMRTTIARIAEGMRATQAWHPNNVTEMPTATTTPQIHGDAVPQGSQVLRSEPLAGAFETTRVRDLENIMSRDRGRAESTIRKLLDGNKFGEAVKTAAYKTLTLRQLADVFKSRMPEVQNYVDTVQKMLTDRNTRATEADEVASDLTKWAAKNKKEAGKLSDLMHDATIFSADPAKDFQDHSAALRQRLDNLRQLLDEDGDPAQQQDFKAQIKELEAQLASEDTRRRRHSELRQRWNGLSREAQTLYIRMRDLHAKNANEVSNLLYERVKKSNINANKRQQMMARIRFEQEAARVRAPYFPLARFGDYYVETRTENGERYVTTFENRVDYERAVDNLTDEGYEIVRKGKRTDRDYKQDGASYAFLEDLVATLGNIDAEENVKSDAIDKAYQLYLNHLPDNTIRKSRIHRKGIKGYSNDAVRAFASSAIKSAYQIARLRHFEGLNDNLISMQRKADQSGDIAQAEIYNEMKKRHDWVMNPDDSTWARRATALGFVYMLGVSPVAGAVNLAQTINVGVPVIASLMPNTNGASAMAKAGFEIVRAAKDFIKGKGSIKNTISAEEKAALKQWEDSGLIDTTRSHDLMGIAETSGTEYNARWHKAMEFVSAFFHKAEVMNRQVTALAAYRVLRQQGVDPEVATKQSADATWDAHFDYTNANRAPFMQRGILKVMFQFKQYSQQMTYYLARNAYKWVFDKNATKEERRAAGVKLAGTLLTTGALAGISGLPAVWSAYALMNLLRNLTGDDDEPWDAETEVRNSLVKAFGEDVADFLIFGAGGAGLSQRLSLSNLWLNEPYRDVEGKELWHFYAEQIAGPTLGSISSNFFEGYNLAVNEGQVQRGLEKMVPKFVKDGSVALRYAGEGATNLRGDVLKTADNFSYSALLLQALGLADSDVIKQYEINNAIKGYETEILDRRRGLLDAYYQAYIERDESAKRSALEKIKAFNRAFPKIAINRQGLRDSIRSRMRYTAETVDGLRLDRRLRYLARENAIAALKD